MDALTKASQVLHLEQPLVCAQLLLRLHLAELEEAAALTAHEAAGGTHPNPHPHPHPNPKAAAGWGRSNTGCAAPQATASSRNTVRRSFQPPQVKRGGQALLAAPKAPRRE